MVVVLVTGVVVHEGDEHQVKAHAQVSHGQVAHEEPGDGDLAVARQQRDENGQVPCHGTDGDEPGEAAQEGEAQQVLTGVKGVRLRGALHKRVVETIKVQFWILKVDVINEIGVLRSRLSGEDGLCSKVASNPTNSLFGVKELQLTFHLHVGHITLSGSLRNVPFKQRQREGHTGEATIISDAKGIHQMGGGGVTSVSCATCGRRSSGWGR